MEVANRVIPIPGSDGVICNYGNVIIVNVSVNNGSAPAADLVFYDNTTNSGTILAVIPKNGANQTFPIGNRSLKAVYVSGTSGWTGSIGLSS